MMITSSANTKVKEMIRLKESSQRRKKGVIVVEGYREIQRALEGGFELIEGFFCRDLLKKEEQKKVYRELILKNKPLWELSSSVYEKITYGERADGLLGVFAYKQKHLNELSVKNNPLFLVLEDVEKPGNLGAILRSADAAGVSAVLVCDEHTEVFNPNAIRASLGAVFCVDIVVGSKENIAGFLQSKGIQILAASLDASDVYFKSVLKRPTAFVLGSEQKGLSDFWLKTANQRIKIPMMGRIDSLNVSVSAAVLLFEALRQRHDG